MSAAATRPIRMLQVISRLNVGGPAIHVTLLTEHFGQRGYEVQLVTGVPGSNEGNMAHYSSEHGLTPVILPELGRDINPLRDVAVTWKLYRLMREFQPDVVHTHTSKAGFAGRLAAKLAGVPVIVHTFHGHVFDGYFGPTTTRLFIRLERLAARLSDTIITLTEGLRRELAEVYRITRRRRITVLPLGFDLERFASTPRHAGGFRAEYGLPADVPLIGIVGRLMAVKNHALFFEAAARLRESLPEARFVVVGDGELRATLEAQVEALGLREAVIFTGWRDAVAPVYSDIDALVISSRSEGTPVPVIEALAAGCPVVATAVGGVPEMLDGGRLGRLVPPGDASALAAALLETVQNPPDMRVPQATMLDRYGITRLVDDLEGLYRGLLAKKQASYRAAPSQEADHR